MKRFELFEYDRETEAQDLDLDLFDQDLTLEEKIQIGKVMQMAKRAVSRVGRALKGLFNLDAFKFGQKKRLKFSIDIPEELSEASDAEKAGSSRTLAGDLVEILTCQYLGGMLLKDGFQIQLQINNQNKTMPEMNAESKRKQVEISDKQKVQGVKLVGIKNTYNERKAFALGSAKRLYEDITSSIKDKSDISAYKATINSAGIAGAGGTKADFIIVLEKMTEDEFVHEFTRAISHKYSQDKAIGTQSGPLAFPVLVIKGVSKKSLRGSGAHAAANKEVYEAMGQYLRGGEKKAKETIDKYIEYMKRPDLRASERKKYERVRNNYLNALEKLINDGKNRENLYKFLGFEQGVEHMFADMVDGQVRVRYSRGKGSRLYKSLQRLFLGKSVTLKTSRISGGEGIGLTFRHKGKIVFKSDIQPLGGGTDTAKHTNFDMAGIPSHYFEKGEKSYDVGNFAKKLSAPRGTGDVPPEEIARIKAEKEAKALAAAEAKLESNLQVVTDKYFKARKNIETNNKLGGKLKTVYEKVQSLGVGDTVSDTYMEEYEQLLSEFYEFYQMQLQRVRNGETFVAYKDFDPQVKEVKESVKDIIKKMESHYQTIGRAAIAREKEEAKREKQADKAINHPLFSTFEKLKASDIKNLPREFVADTKRMSFDDLRTKWVKVGKISKSNTSDEELQKVRDRFI